MEFLRPSRKRTVISETVYVLLNVALAVAILIVTDVTTSLVATIGLVLLSKWRVFAVRPQFWATNVLANAVDVIVGVSFAIFLNATIGQLPAQIGLTILYILWLLLLKPKTRRKWVLPQAGVSFFVGLNALAVVSYNWWSSIVVLVAWVIGYSAARHVLAAYSEKHYALLSLIWAMVTAELAWIGFHWSFAYPIGLGSHLLLSQTAVISTVVGFLSERVYAAYRKAGEHRVRLSDIGVPLVFSLSIIIVLLTIFNGVKTI